MFKILLAIDGSEGSDKAIDKTIEIAEKMEAEITILSVVENVPILILPEITAHNLDSLLESLENKARKIVKTGEKAFAEKGLNYKTLIEKGTGPVAETICRVAEQGEFDLVVMGSRGLGGLKEFLLGSVSNKVAHDVKTSIMLVK